MKFPELESLMSSRGVTTLADIARALDTTPQAVSNWKARGEVPSAMVIKLQQKFPAIINSQSPARHGGSIENSQSSIVNSPSAPPARGFSYQYSMYEEDTISLSDLLLTMAEQLKVIVLVPFITVFLTFTYVQFIQAPEYVSWATVLLPENKTGNLGGLAGLASQFGVNVPMDAAADLSSPSLYPELLRSRTFAEKILDKEFYTDKYGKKLSLLSILTHGDKPPKFGRDTLIAEAVKTLNEEVLEFDQDPKSTFSVIKVTAFEPIFAKELTNVVLAELEALNRYFKSQTVSEKTTFIENRIASVESDLEASEERLKEFNENNRQISSPSLQLELDRLGRDVEIQKGVYLTLKQQLELAKIEEVQEASIVQVLDKPQVSFGPSNKNLKLRVVLAGVLGIGLGIMLGFVRAYANNTDVDERKKIRRVKHLIKKKGKELLIDRRISGTISAFLLMGSPLFLGYKSQNPVFFGMYSAKLMLVNTLYIMSIIFFVCLFIYFTRKK
ncbi:hypothetical protein JYT44_00715 [Caldithrix abyssi]|nr:hypothetical protein [Caldithrix abyssi]